MQDTGVFIVLHPAWGSVQGGFGEPAQHLRFLHSVRKIRSCQIYPHALATAPHTGYLDNKPVREWAEFTERQRARHVPASPRLDRRVLPMSQGGWPLTCK